MKKFKTAVKHFIPKKTYVTIKIGKKSLYTSAVATVLVTAAAVYYVLFI